jgi:hypothetical protein
MVSLNSTHISVKILDLWQAIINVLRLFQVVYSYILLSIGSIPENMCIKHYLAQSSQEFSKVGIISFYR